MNSKTKKSADDQRRLGLRPESGLSAGKQYLSRFNLKGCREYVAGTLVEKEHTRDRLLISAVQLFGMRGYDVCSLKQVGAIVGVSASAIYNHYPSKIDLLIAAVDYVLSDFMNYVLGTISEGDPEVMLARILRRQVTYRTENFASAEANDRLLDPEFMSRVMPADDMERFSEALSEYVHIVRTLAVRVRKNDEFDSTLQSFAILNVTNHAGSWYRPGGHLSPQNVAEQCVDLVFKMLGHDKAPHIGDDL